MDQRAGLRRRLSYSRIQHWQKHGALEFVAARLAGPKISDVPLIKVFDLNRSDKCETHCAQRRVKRVLLRRAGNERDGVSLGSGGISRNDVARPNQRGRPAIPMSSVNPKEQFPAP